MLDVGEKGVAARRLSSSNDVEEVVVLLLLVVWWFFVCHIQSQALKKLSQSNGQWKKGKEKEGLQQPPLSLQICLTLFLKTHLRKWKGKKAVELGGLFPSNSNDVTLNSWTIVNKHQRISTQDSSRLAKWVLDNFVSNFREYPREYHWVGRMIQPLKDY